MDVSGSETNTGGTVLVVDDDPEVVSLVEAYLNRLDDVAVHTETDPERALDWVDAGDVHCLVSDYNMPVMDGLTLATRIRDRIGDVPFVVFTGEGDAELAERVRDRGGAFVRKSADPSAVEAVSDFVAKRLPEGDRA